MSSGLDPAGNRLLSDIKILIAQGKQQIAISVNAAMSMLYWEIGHRINKEMANYTNQESYGKR